jgi:hypothetical protein
MTSLSPQFDYHDHDDRGQHTLSGRAARPLRAMQPARRCGHVLAELLAAARLL